MLREECKIVAFKNIIEFNTRKFLIYILTIEYELKNTEIYLSEFEKKNLKSS